MFASVSAARLKAGLRSEFDIGRLTDPGRYLMPYVRILGLVTFFLSLTAAVTTPDRAAGIKPADQAFQLRAQWDEEEGIELSWSIAPGYYIYRDRIGAVMDGQALRVDTEQGELKDDPNFGLTEIYRLSGAATVAAELLPAKGQLIVTYQGCGDNTICYPPISKAIDLTTLLVEDAPEGSSKVTAAPRAIAGAHIGNTGDSTPTAAMTGGIEAESVVLGGSLFSTLLAFLGFGLLLSFTPCVFPMIPILSGMLARSGGELPLKRSILLSTAYVLAMATAYSTLGVFAAWSGGNLQAALQTPIAIFAMSIVFVALALSMFGLFELQLPQSWTSKLATAAGNKGSIGGAAVLGFGSALIVGPCVTPPLAAALVFVAQTGQVLRGSLSLFALGLGMGLPLIAFGVLGARMLPRSGRWLARVKHLFGFVFIALAIWMVSRVIPVRLVTAAWALFFLGVGAYFATPFVLARGRWQLQPVAGAGIGALAIVYGAALAIGAVIAEYEPLRPLATIGLVASPANGRSYTDEFQIVSSETALDAAIDLGRKQGRAMMVDFSADWCSECKLMERNVFSQEVVRQQLHGILLIRADLTHFDQSSKNLMRRFSVVGPPTIVFLNPDGSEIGAARVVGGIGVAGLLSKIAKALRA
jgi:thiol:disulfide interchange protein DsbD